MWSSEIQNAQQPKYIPALDLVKKFFKDACRISPVKEVEVAWVALCCDVVVLLLEGDSASEDDEGGVEATTCFLVASEELIAPAVAVVGTLGGGTSFNLGVANDFSGNCDLRCCCFWTAPKSSLEVFFWAGAALFLKFAFDVPKNNIENRKLWVCIKGSLQK